MPFTYKSSPFVWLAPFALFGLTASGVTPVGVIARSRKRPRIVSGSPDQSPLALDWSDVYRWESEGGAPRLCVNSAIRDPANATPSPSLLVMTAAEAR
jgi:hypothetical protein